MAIFYHGIDLNFLMFNNMEQFFFFLLICHLLSYNATQLQFLLPLLLPSLPNLPPLSPGSIPPLFIIDVRFLQDML